MHPQDPISYPEKYPAEMYKDDVYRCTFSNEETRALLKQGYSFDMKEGKDRAEYKVYHHEAAAKRGPGRPKAT